MLSLGALNNRQLLPQRLMKQAPQPAAPLLVALRPNVHHHWGWLVDLEALSEIQSPAMSNAMSCSRGMADS